MFRIMSEPFLF